MGTELKSLQTLQNAKNDTEVLEALKALYNNEAYTLSPYGLSPFEVEILEDIVNNFNDYQRANLFLERFRGCSDGGTMFTYNDDCKAFYIKHIDDLEEMAEEWEEGTDTKVSSLYKGFNLRHYTALCWFAYETIVNNLRTIIEETEN